MKTTSEFNSYSKFLTWFAALMLGAVLAGCGGGGQSSILGGGGNVGPAVNAKAVTGFSLAGAAGTVDEAAKTIAVTVPNGTDVTALPATFSTTGGSVTVGGVTQVSGTTTNDFTAPVDFTVTAADGSSATYTVTVTVSSVTAKAISAFSLAGVAGTIDEAAKTIAVNVPSGTDVTALPATFGTTGTSVKVGGVAQISGTTTNDFTAPVVYTVTAADASTATYTVTAAVSSATAKAITAFSFAGYPGIAGAINEAAKTIAVTLPIGTDVTALVAKFTTTGTGVTVGSTAQASGTTANDFSAPVAYVVSAGDGSTATYTASVTLAASSAKAITAFSIAGFPAVAGTINEAAKTIAVTMPNGTDLTALVATFATTGVSVKVGTTVQTSTATPNNFTNPVTYTVSAADASTADYAVTVSVAPSSAKAITAYSFAGYAGATGTIDEAAKTIAVTVPNGTDVSALVATFTTTGATVKVGAAIQTSTATPNNFTNPVTYTVSAADASTASYAVTVTVGAATAVLPGPAGSLGAAATNPTVISSNPSNGDINVPTQVHNGTTNVVSVRTVTATFNEAMDPTTITPLGVFTLKETLSGNDVPGVVTMNAAGTIATF